MRALARNLLTVTHNSVKMSAAHLGEELHFTVKLCASAHRMGDRAAILYRGFEREGSLAPSQTEPTETQHVYYLCSFIRTDI